MFIQRCEALRINSGLLGDWSSPLSSSCSKADGDDARGSTSRSTESLAADEWVMNGKETRRKYFFVTTGLVAVFLLVGTDGLEIGVREMMFTGLVAVPVTSFSSSSSAGMETVTVGEGRFSLQKLFLSQ